MYKCIIRRGLNGMPSLHSDAYARNRMWLKMHDMVVDNKANARWKQRLMQEETRALEKRESEDGKKKESFEDKDQYDFIHMAWPALLLLSLLFLLAS